jgi:CheY-like chemotaxis protein
MGGADLAEGLVGDHPKLKRLMGNMRHAAQRGQTLTKQLLAFSRRQPLTPETVDISRQLMIIIDLLSRSLRGDIQIVSQVPADLSKVSVDPSQLELAFLNIGLNARDALPEGGILRITARNFTADGKGDLSGDYVLIAIEDNGIGMEPEVKARAFEPFFTTKEVGRGSGLGLSQAYGFAQQSGGVLALESAPGKGTKVTLMLPAASSAAVKAAETPVRPRTNGSANVLLVEDDAAVAELAINLLDGAGYKIRTACDASAALQILRSGAPVDLVFSDIMMPGGMNGAELARVVREEFPGVFILLATGYAAAAAGEVAKEFPLITKPYGRDLLLDKFAKILGEAG